MKIDGKELPKSPNSDVIVIPRSGREPIVFKVVALLDYDEFHRLVKSPKVGKKIVPGKGEVEDLNDKRYLEEVKDYGRKQSFYLFIKSLLLGTPTLEFDKIKLSEPDTWLLFDQEFKDAGFNSGEINYIASKIMEVNSLSEAKIDAARESFLRSQALDQPTQ